MTEETTQNATPEVAKTDTTFVPAWQIQAEKLEKVVADGNGAQVVYKSSNDDWCEPTLATKAYTTNDYPFVVEKPEGFVSPKYDWTHRKWVESANIAQGQKIEELSDDLKKVVQDQMQIKQDQANADKEKQADDKKNDQAIKLMTMISTQMGILNAKVDKLSKPENTNPETQSQEGGNK